MTNARERIRGKLESGAALKVLFLNDIGFRYGAGLAELRQIKSFLMMGHEVKALCWDAGEKEPLEMILAGASEAWQGLHSRKHLHLECGRSAGAIVEALTVEIAAEAPDVVIVGNLHAAGWPLEIFLGLRDLDVLTVAYAHDCYLFTGRCAYPGECRLYLTGCDESCLTCDSYPPLHAGDIAEAWRLRRTIFSGTSGIPLATNSLWTLGFARSALGDSINAEVVYLGLDTDVFKPMPRDLCRRLLGIPLDAFVILGGAVNVQDHRKGGRFFDEVLAILQNEACFLLFGDNSTRFERAHTVGFVDEHCKMPLLYGAADLFMATSTEEAFGQTIMEAAACGVPVAAFAVGGVPEIARHGLNARLVEEVGVASLVDALRFFMSCPDTCREYGEAGRKLAKDRFSLLGQGLRWNEYILNQVSLPDRVEKAESERGIRSPPALSEHGKDLTPEISVDRVPRFCIVTPCLNAEAFIDEAIAGILTQAGPFRIRYHIQDGGSSDGTLEKIEQWEKRLSGGSLPLFCKGIEFSFATGADKGMYDAVNRGFEHIGLEETDYMTWLNADDRLLQGAFAAAGHLLGTFKSVDWVGGRAALIDQEGAMTGVFELTPYPRRSLRAGIFDGRRLGFVMQEGTFWRAALWQRVGGLRPDLRLAGDFDLWRRFAEYAEYVVADFHFASHRRRRGQLSEFLDDYYEEVERIVDREVRDAEWERHQRVVRSLDAMEVFGYAGKVIRFNFATRKWGLRNEAYDCRETDQSIIVTPNCTKLATGMTFLSGFRAKEVAYPHLSLPAGIRWIINPEACLSIDCPKAEEYLLGFRCRSFHQNVHGVLVHEDCEVTPFVVPYTGHERDCLVLLRASLHEGVNRLTLKLTLEDAAIETPDLWLLMIACEAVPLAEICSMP
ncbi:glycosyltransferase [Desulfatiglans anilini]|uniref:glycosyltransferase n=1 Tax=Desulfatiglans anilini TaxID=90728 RepID=UPI00040BB04D|nr:glycosyltransferase [Desulfatiglans anilini]